MSELFTTKFSNVKVPEELKERIKSIATAEGRAMWQVILDGISFYESQRRRSRLKEELPLHEKVSWYIAKLSMAVCHYLATGKDENFYETLATIDEVGKRLKVDVSLLTSTLNNFRNSRRKTPKKRAAVLKTLKLLIQDLITKVVEEPRQTSQALEGQ